MTDKAKDTKQGSGTSKPVAAKPERPKRTMGGGQALSDAIERSQKGQRDWRYLPRDEQE